MLEVCLYVLHSLHKDENQSEYRPQKIIFALRDHFDKNIKIQQLESNKITNSLEKIKVNSNFDYKNFFTISATDVYCLPSAFRNG
jgi:hypothetical protein